MPLHKFISEINHCLNGLIPGARIVGRAESVTRTRGADTETLPAIVNGKQYEYVGPDDKFPLVVYHKLNSITTKPVLTNQGYGDKLSDTVNTYTLSLFAYLDRVKTGLEPDELFLTIQANMADLLKIQSYSGVVVRITNVILNGEQVFASEFRGTSFKLPVEKSMFQINYTIESTFKKACFENCPEVC